jgi:hypothetical protein
MVEEGVPDSGEAAEGRIISFSHLSIADNEHAAIVK